MRVENLFLAVVVKGRTGKALSSRVDMKNCNACADCFHEDDRTERLMNVAIFSNDLDALYHEVDVKHLRVPSG